MVTQQLDGRAIFSIRNRPPASHVRFEVSADRIVARELGARDEAAIGDALKGGWSKSSMNFGTKKK
jgi:hypothetical protein